MGELQDTQNKRRKKMEEAKALVQPYVILVGKLGDLQAAYVVINNHLYIANSTLRAADICFKSVFALNAAYPPESQPLWTWIQKFILKITTKWDVEYTAVNSLISDLTINLL